LHDLGDVYSERGGEADRNANDYRQRETQSADGAVKRYGKSSEIGIVFKCL